MSTYSNSRPTPASSTISGVWGQDYLAQGFLDEGGAVHPVLVCREKVEKLAKAMGDAELTRTQVRRYLSHCRAIEARIRSVPPDERADLWRRLSAEFLMMDSTADYAINKSTSKLPTIFAEFIRRNVAAVHSSEDFLDGFLRHFEALVGFGWKFFKNSAR